MLKQKMQDIIDFVVFEEETSLYYPWKLNSKQISARAERIAALLPDNYTTDDIYDAVSQVAGEKNTSSEMMNETKQISQRIQDILDGFELRTGKKKVQTKEDLKKCFKIKCLNIYSAEKDGHPRLYRRSDLTQWAAEAFSRGENYFCAEPVDPKEPCGELKLAKPRYVYTCSRALTKEEFKAVFGENE